MIYDEEETTIEAGDGLRKHSNFFKREKSEVVAVSLLGVKFLVGCFVFDLLSVAHSLSNPYLNHGKRSDHPPV